jgi:glycolate oxidase
VSAETVTDVAQDLAARLPPGAVVTDHDVLQAYRRDQASWAGAGTPAALVRPASTAEVQTVLRFASAHRLPVVPRGAGSGLAGGANAVDGCLVLSLARMDRVVEIDAAAMCAVVQPGVINAALHSAVADHGLWYAPDPASRDFSTIGGNLATNAGGLCCVKYGVTRDSTLGLEVVLADGGVVRTGGRTVKNVAGYDLTGLFVGSEGTLGVITEAVLRLQPSPTPGTTVVAFFATLPAAGRAVVDICGVARPSLLELMDRTTLRAVEDWKHMGIDTSSAVLLLARTDGPDADADATRIARACEAAGAREVLRSTDAEEAELLLAARRLAFPALERLGTVALDDIGVPIPEIPRLLAEIEEIAAAHRVQIGTFGHAGDGNMHPTIVYDPASLDRAKAAFDGIVRAALDLGGTITGEHGVGLLKQPYLAAALGAEGVRVHRAIKHALDPLNILNPGKVVSAVPD